ncbi:hypothetical protein GGE43_004736 [Agrobacterium tumefaciens]|uniref:DUF5710 domain-containing protein n=1 Tax=Agrobacterium radiobacter TaxID=362 RepID=A0ABR6J6Q5_AGRRD|nr:DUF5710 domain-containing protein [Agrobacterium radiobacter]TGE76546.1 hypothetical protein C9410_23245 [Rhizobium sp. SEMIA 439]MBB4283917.1 hypothetical protein [Agrobacterium radiobacter]MBB4319586.1 hypothetical protein [Agrobacterium radiobacter]MBB4325974.1 hypothetical protein [Agrobacterium radiobacter]MBB4337882.1 hypothetical protein [Agrobacterium radiobacter]
MHEDDWKDSSQNVFEMLVANGGPGFWIRRTTWDGTVARIIRAGVFTKPSPYFGNPSVLMDVYLLEGGLKEGLAMVPVPGTYKTWRRIEAPTWVEQARLRPLDDPAIDIALAVLDRRRGKGYRKAPHKESVPEVVRIRLLVPYARKDEAKGIGARWSPTDKSWWLPADDSSTLTKARVLGFLNV